MFKGVFLALFASALFGFIYYYPVYLKPLSVVDIFCWRLIMTFPAILLLVLLKRQWYLVNELIIRVKKQPIYFVALLTSAFLIAIQMLIFVWAPLTGRGLSASLGYFMLPLVMVVCGRFLYKESFSLLQIIAITMAVLGVFYEIYMTGAFSWVTAIIMFGYPLYFVFRKTFKIDGIAGTLSDFFIVAFACMIYFLVNYDFDKIIADIATFPLFIPLFGIITGIAFASYFLAIKILPFGLFGLLSYIEPVLLTLVSIIFLKEVIKPEQMISYGFLWGAVFVLLIDGIVFSLKKINCQRTKK